MLFFFSKFSPLCSIESAIFLMPKAAANYHLLLLTYIQILYLLCNCWGECRLPTLLQGNCYRGADDDKNK